MLVGHAFCPEPDHTLPELVLRSVPIGICSPGGRLWDDAGTPPKRLTYPDEPQRTRSAVAAPDSFKASIFGKSSR